MIVNFYKRRLRCVLVAVFVLVFHLCGGFLHLFTKDFDENFDYPYNGNVKFLVDQMMNGTEFFPVNFYYFKFKTNCSHVCMEPLRLLFLVKSSPENYAHRRVIRSTWGNKHQLGGNIKTVFLIGERASETDKLTEESNKFHDLIQGNFSDTYFNNTMKTMMGFKWAFDFCSKKVEYYMFVDDDYYISPRNVLKFVKDPYNYPVADMVKKYSTKDLSSDKFELYAGHVILSSPFRSYFSKWYVPLQEYPYNKWPPYVTAGSYILSQISLKRMYHASLLTEHFRFDDIYIAILAFKLKIEPIHNENFYFDEKPQGDLKTSQAIAVHGYDPDELWKVWNEQNDFHRS